MVHKETNRQADTHTHKLTDTQAKGNTEFTVLL